MHDMHSNIAAVQAIAPAVQTATVSSDEIDLQGFAAAEIVINTGAIVSAGDFTASVEEAAEIDSPPVFTAVAAANLLGSLPATLEANKTYRIGYVGSKRYLVVKLTKNSGTSIAAGAVVVKGHPAVAPVA